MNVKDISAFVKTVFTIEKDLVELKAELKDLRSDLKELTLEVANIKIDLNRQTDESRFSQERIWLKFEKRLASIREASSIT